MNMALQILIQLFEDFEMDRRTPQTISFVKYK